MRWWWWVREKQQEEANESALGLFGIKRRDDRRRWKKKTWKKKLRRMKNHFKCFLTLEILHQTENVSWELKNICTHSRAKRQPVHNQHTPGPRRIFEWGTHNISPEEVAVQQQPKKWRNEMKYIKKSSKNQKQSSKRVEMNECEWFIQTALTWTLFLSTLRRRCCVCCVFFSSVVANSSFCPALAACLEKEFLNMILHLNNTPEREMGAQKNQQQAAVETSAVARIWAQCIENRVESRDKVH